MGRPDVNCEPPRIVSLTLGVALYGLAWGQDPGSGSGWHSATDRTDADERLTAAQLADLFAAAALGEAQLDAALSLGPTSRAWSKAKQRAENAVQGGAAALLTACRARYAAWSLTMFETEPLHIEAVRELRALADRIEAAGECRAFIAGADYPTGDSVSADVHFGGEAGRIIGMAGWVKSATDGATFIHADTDFDALDAAAV